MGQEHITLKHAVESAPSAPKLLQGRELLLQELNTEPARQLTGSSWWFTHHDVKTAYFKEYCFLVEEALGWSMVSTTSVERQGIYDLGPLRGNTHSFHNPGIEVFNRKALSCPESPMESCQGGTLGLRIMPGPARMWY